MKLFLMSITMLAMVSQCQDNTPISEITKITYGTSFGSCLGYCNNVVLFSSEGITKKMAATRSKNLPDKECSKNWKGFNKLTSKVDLESFSQLQEVIGCPDCADGGAEWIEIFTAEGSKKVMFEYRKEPAEVKSFISDLRKQFDSFGECK